ncbi:MAG TPA: VOC family protein [Pseudomonadales bacterium]|nr:VOC family protein [Pseudomonadales bacterium]
MIPTHGLTHLSLEVADPEASLRFYVALLGVREYFRDADSIQVLGPGAHDVLVFTRGSRAGRRGGVDHFGFRLRRPEDMDIALATARALGARILRHGEHGPGLPFLYLLDPDGYEIEFWFE